jgi:hypothetical protein
MSMHSDDGMYTPAELISRFSTSDGRAGDCEGAFRRGVHQALALARGAGVGGGASEPGRLVRVAGGA